MSDLPEVNTIQQYIDPQTGKLTVEGLRLFTRLLLVTRDHEARITALEP